MHMDTPGIVKFAQVGGFDMLSFERDVSEAGVQPRPAIEAVVSKVVEKREDLLLHPWIRQVGG